MAKSKWTLDHDPFKQLIQAMAPSLPKQVYIQKFASVYIPRVGDIVVDQQDIVGRVQSHNDKDENRFVDVEDECGVLFHINTESDFFRAANSNEIISFIQKRHAHRNVYEGGMYRRKGFPNSPLLLEKIEINEFGWEVFRFTQFSIRSTKRISLRNLNEFEFIDFGLGSHKNFKFLLNEENESLEWKIETSIVKTGETACALNVGSPFSFRNFSTAQKELDRWKAQMYIKRVASVLNDGWTPKFKPNGINFYLDIIKDDLSGEKHFEVDYTGEYNHRQVYFRDIEVAVCATKLISVGVYEIAEKFLQLE